MTKKLNPLKHYMLNLNVQKRNINQNKNSINIINKKRFKKFSLSNNSKNKNKPSSKQIIKNELKSKDNNLMVSKLKIKSSNRFSNSYNLGRYINKKNLVIFNKKKLKERKYLIKNIKRENDNNKNVLNLKSINNNNSIYTISNRFLAFFKFRFLGLISNRKIIKKK